MFIIWIVLYFLAGGIVSTIYNVVLDVDDVCELGAITVLWPVGFTALVICILVASVGYIPKCLGEVIKKRNKKEDKK